MRKLLIVLAFLVPVATFGQFKTTKSGVPGNKLTGWMKMDIQELVPGVYEFYFTDKETGAEYFAITVNGQRASDFKDYVHRNGDPAYASEDEELIFAVTVQGPELDDPVILRKLYRDYDYQRQLKIEEVTKQILELKESKEVTDKLRVKFLKRELKKLRKNWNKDREELKEDMQHRSRQHTIFIYNFDFWVTNDESKLETTGDNSDARNARDRSKPKRYN